jgi:hypothetical protein
MTQALTPPEIAAELKIPLRTARHWMRSMPGVFRVGRHLRIARLDFERWITRRKDEHAWEREERAQEYAREIEAKYAHEDAMRAARAPLNGEKQYRGIVPRTKPTIERERDRIPLTFPRTKPRKAP